MKPNVGNTDRVVRILIGLGLFSLFFLLDGNARWIGILGVVPIGTAFLRWGPADGLIGINTGAPGDKRTP
jgi:hypothetical protein